MERDLEQEGIQQIIRISVGNLLKLRRNLVEKKEIVESKIKNLFTHLACIKKEFDFIENEIKKNRNICIHNFDDSGKCLDCGLRK